MATRSLVGIQTGQGINDNEVVYVHWNGDIEDNGVMLQTYYNTLDKVKELIAGGDMSSLKPNINDIQYYSSPDSENWELQKSKPGIMNKDTLKDGLIEFVYLFCAKEHKWRVMDVYEKNPVFKDLQTEIERLL